MTTKEKIMIDPIKQMLCGKTHSEIEQADPCPCDVCENMRECLDPKNANMKHGLGVYYQRQINSELYTLPLNKHQAATLNEYKESAGFYSDTDACGSLLSLGQKVWRWWKKNRETSADKYNIDADKLFDWTHAKYSRIADGSTSKHFYISPDAMRTVLHVEKMLGEKFKKRKAVMLLLGLGLQAQAKSEV